MTASHEKISLKEKDIIEFDGETYVAYYLLEDIREDISTAIQDYIFDKSKIFLRDIDNRMVVELSHFSDALSEWPYAGAPENAKISDIMFWSFKRDDFNSWNLRRYFENNIRDYCNFHVKSFSKFEKIFFESFLKFNSIFCDGPEDTSSIDSKLAEKLYHGIVEILELYDSEILTEE